MVLITTLGSGPNCKGVGKVGISMYASKNGNNYRPHLNHCAEERSGERKGRQVALSWHDSVSLKKNS